MWSDFRSSGSFQMNANAEQVSLVPLFKWGSGQIASRPSASRREGGGCGSRFVGRCHWRCVLHGVIIFSFSVCKWVMHVTLIFVLFGGGNG